MKVVADDVATKANGSGWFILGICVLTVVMVYTVPTVLLPLLFAEISAELNLDIVQLGIVWGSTSLSSMVIGLVGGSLGDRFGSKRTLIVLCILLAAMGLLRSYANSYQTLVATMLLYGLIAPAIPPNLHKAGAFCFPDRRGISTVTISTGFAFALFVGSRYTATGLSPMLGGWRAVLQFFSLMALLFSVVWLLVPNRFLPQPSKDDSPFFKAVFGSVQHVLRVREVWIIGFGSLLFWGAVRGFLGYAPLYLRNTGWEPSAADSTISLFFLASLFAAIPSTILAERMGTRRPLMIVAMLLTGVGIALIGSGNATLLTIGVIGAGLLFDSYMGNHQAAVLDLKGIGVYAGSALGTLVMFREAGGFIGPPIGNWLAQFGDGVPFIFWGMMGLIAALIYAMKLSGTVRDRG